MNVTPHPLEGQFSYTAPLRVSCRMERCCPRAIASRLPTPCMLVLPPSPSSRPLPPVPCTSSPLKLSTQALVSGSALGEHRLRLDSIHLQYQKIQETGTATQRQRLEGFMRKGMSLILPNFTPQLKKFELWPIPFPYSEKGCRKCFHLSFTLDSFADRAGVSLASSSQKIQWVSPLVVQGKKPPPRSMGHSCSLGQCGPWLRGLPALASWSPCSTPPKGIFMGRGVAISSFPAGTR